MRHRSRAALIGVLAVVLAAAAATAAVIANERHNELEMVSQQLREALASADTALASRNLNLAETRLAEATTLLRQSPKELSLFATQIEKAQGEVASNRADQDRLERFLQLSRRALDGTYDFAADNDRAAKEALASYGVLSDSTWQQALDASSTSDQDKEQVRQRAYATLLCLADFQIHSNGTAEKARRSIELLEKAQKIREPTRAFYWIRGHANGWIGDAAAKDADLEKRKTAPVVFAWDYFFEAQTARWNDDLDAAVTGYRQALRIEPDHCNSLYWLGFCLGHYTQDDYTQDFEASIAYYTACIALRPDFWPAYANRGSSYLKLKNWNEAASDFTMALKTTTLHAKTKSQLQFLRAAAYDQMGRANEAGEDRLMAIKIVRAEFEETPEEFEAPRIEAIVCSADHCSDNAMELELRRLALTLARANPGTPSELVARLFVELGLVLREQGQLLEAEQTLRKGLELFEEKLANDWVRFALASVLGEVRAAQGRPDEAEPLLVFAYEGIRDHQDGMNSYTAHHLADARQRIIDFYEAAGRDDEAHRLRAEHQVEPRQGK
jgi:tetratricopeptide (TPR) repeat protein